MKDYINIIIADRLSLLRALVVSFFIVLPFTFVPVLIGGWSWAKIAQRFPLSSLYAFGFSFIVVIVAVIYNYQSLVDRKRHFDKPAFKKLEFYGRLDGVGSIVDELETFLLGKVGSYYFRLNLVDPDLKVIKIEIVPLIDPKENKELKSKLRRELGLKENFFFGLTIKAKESDLQNENYLLDKLLELDLRLTELGAKPLEIDESTL